jgi:two-component system, NarL family, sensor histidine kinase DesK
MALAQREHDRVIELRSRAASPAPGVAAPRQAGGHHVGMRDVDDLPLDPARRAEDTFAGQADTDLTDGRWTRGRIAVIRLIITFFLLAPFFSKPRPSVAQAAFLVPATLILIVIVNRYVVGFARPLRPHNRASTAWLIVILALGISILAVGGLDWIGAVFIAGAAAGRLTRLAWQAAAAGVCTAAAALGVGLAQSVGLGGGALELTAGPLLATFFAYTAARRSELVDTLRQTRAELARMAVADERLRIARDLHDLLGHSLSLITLKAELAGRVIGADPDRAATEIADLETVARRSLGEVRAAVTSYRQPSLAAEIAAARQMLSAAGMDCRVDAPTPIDLPPDADALLAWTVREGATNVVRHSGARSATITVTVAADEASAEIADDGVGPAWESALGPGEKVPGADGSGLTGLTERARLAGAQISVGEGRGGKGFRLLVRVPPGRLAGG